MLFSSRGTERGLSFREVAALFKPGIIASNVLTAMAGLILARATLDSAVPGAVEAGLLELGIGAGLLVGGAAAINNGLDHALDARMTRTMGRPTATGRMSPFAAEAIGACLAILGLGLLAAVRPLSALIGAAGLLVYVFPYTLWTKRRSPLSSIVGGIAGAIPPLIGWSAADPGLGGPALALFLFLIVWQQAHVRALALRRAGEYRQAGLPLAGLGDGRAEGLTRRGRAGILFWVAAAQLPLAAVLPSLSPAMFGPFLAVSLGGGALWFVAGFLTSRPVRSPDPGRWGSSMFFASLAQLVSVFASLLLLSLAAG